MENHNTITNPDLTVGENNKQRWNQAEHRRQGFHNANHVFRRALMVRSKNVLVLRPQVRASIQISADLRELINHPAFSALCCIREDEIVLEESADDFSTRRPHSIQSISKLPLRRSTVPRPNTHQGARLIKRQPTSIVNHRFESSRQYRQRCCHCECSESFSCSTQSASAPTFLTTDGIGSSINGLVLMRHRSVNWRSAA